MGRWLVDESHDFLVCLECSIEPNPDNTNEKAMLVRIRGEIEPSGKLCAVCDPPMPEEAAFCQTRGAPTPGRRTATIPDNFPER